MFLEITDHTAQDVYSVFDQAQGSVAVSAQQPAHLPRRVAVIDVGCGGKSRVARRAVAALLIQHGLNVLGRDAVAIPQVTAPGVPRIALSAIPLELEDTFSVAGHAAVT